MADEQIMQVKIYKAWGGRTPTKMWSNTYHVFTNVAIDSDAWPTIVTGFTNLEQKFHLTPVNFMRAVVSTARKEPVYDPKQLRVMELGGTGGRVIPAGENALDLNLALKCKKAVAFGRAGTVYWRGVLHTADVNVVAGGDAVLTDGFVSTMLQQLIPLNTDIMGAAMAAMGGGFWVMKERSDLDDATADTIRTVKGFGPSGVSVNARNHRYFDKAASDDGVGVGT